MARTPKRTQPQRQHLPALNPDRLKLLIQQIEASKTLSPGSKRAAIQSLQAAANPNAEAPEVVIQSLPNERRISIEATMQMVSAFQVNIMARGRVALQSMSEDEWNGLIDETNNQGT